VELVSAQTLLALGQFVWVESVEGASCLSTIEQLLLAALFHPPD